MVSLSHTEIIYHCISQGLVIPDEREYLLPSNSNKVFRLHNIIGFAFSITDSSIYISTVKKPEPGYLFSNDTYTFCSNVTVDNEDRVFGHDYLLYLRESAESVEYKALFLRLVNTSDVPWYEVVADRRIQNGTHGWQSFNLKSTYEELNQTTFCVLMLVDEINNGSTTRLNKTALKERFVLDACSPSEAAQQPFVVTYVHFSNPSSSTRITRRRSVALKSKGSNRGECSRQSHTVDPSKYLQQEVVYPKKVDVGICGGADHIKPPSEPEDYMNTRNTTTGHPHEEEGEETTKTILQQCAPTGYTSLPVLVKNENTIVLKSVPNSVIESCTLQSF